MYRKYDVKKLNEKELKLLTAFMIDNQGKGVPTVYLTTEGLTGMGFSLIATFDKPKKKDGKIDFGNCIDITDYDYRLEQY